ncbi:MAG TPA: hypothetical protein VD837_06000 [Terriglobales bacterium]|nr:hypothetical protein [Terriglobales bacterium]
MAYKAVASAVILSLLVSFGCGGVGGASSSSRDNDSPGAALISGVLMWKGDTSGTGLYGSESKLTPAVVGGGGFGKLAQFPLDGMIMAQPLYVSGLDMGTRGKLNAVIVATEHNSVYAFDADSKSTKPLWERHYTDHANGIVPAPDNIGGRSTFGGEIGITGTPVIDPATGAMYFVTMLQRNGHTEQWLRSIDIRTGQDYGAGSVQIQASVPGDGRGSQNGQIPFDASIQNQRMGLAIASGLVVIGWGSFSDYGVYHGWLMAYDRQTLQQRAVFNPTPNYQAEDTAFGPADHGGGGSFWQGGASISVDAAGNIYVVAADGSFNAHRGGQNYGDTVLKLTLANGRFTVVDWFTPSNEACVNPADIEIGSGGVALLPESASPGRRLAAVINKEGRLYLLDTNNLGKFNPAGDTQIPQQFLVGNKACIPGMGEGFAEGPDWQRLYGNPSYWNGNLYLATSNGPLRQYKLQNGLLGTAPFAVTNKAFGVRGGNSVVSASGTQNAIVWAYDKSSDGGVAVLHAYEANDVSRELWNSNMNRGRDGMGVGVGFGTPIVADGKIITTFDKSLVIYGLL